jgi:hypothetical protein
VKDLLIAFVLVGFSGSLLGFTAKHLRALSGRTAQLGLVLEGLERAGPGDPEYLVEFREATGEANQLWSLIRLAPKQLGRINVLGCGTLGLIGVLGGGNLARTGGIVCFGLGGCGWAFSALLARRIEIGVSQRRDQIRTLARNVERKLARESGPPDEC